MRVGRIARNSTGMLLIKKGVFEGLTIPDITAADFDNPLRVPLLVCQETMDEEVEANGTVGAQVPLYSKVRALKLNFKMENQATTFLYRWMLVKEPDGENLIGTAAVGLTSPVFHSSNDTPAAREIRKFCIAKGWGITDTNHPITIRPFIRRHVLRRLSGMREGDIISFQIAKSAAGTTALLHGDMTSYIKANA